MDNQSQFFYSSIFKISISPKNYHFSSLDWAFKLICEKSGLKNSVILIFSLFLIDSSYFRTNAQVNPRQPRENIDIIWQWTKQGGRWVLNLLEVVGTGVATNELTERIEVQRQRNLFKKMEYELNNRCENYLVDHNRSISLLINTLNARPSDRDEIEKQYLYWRENILPNVSRVSYCEEEIIQDGVSRGIHVMPDCPVCSSYVQNPL